MNYIYVYDRDQIQKDMVKILDFYGKHVPYGFFTVNMFETNDFIIIDFFDKFIKVYDKNHMINNVDYKEVTEFYTTSGIGNKIMNLILDIEDNSM
jgi:hypothetical protein